MKTKRLYPVLILMTIIFCSCGNKTEKAEAISAQNVVEKIKDDWSKVEKPLEILIAGREKDELEAIGSIAVWFDGIKNNSENTNKVVEFHYDGISFKPVTPVYADSSARPVIFYPYKTGLSFKDSLNVQTPLSQYLKGTISYVEIKEDKIITSYELQDLKALLRFRFQSDNLSDILESVKISGKCIRTEGTILPIKGEINGTGDYTGVCELNTDCLLNNGQPFDFHLIPTEDGGDLEVTVTVNSLIRSQLQFRHLEKEA